MLIGLIVLGVFLAIVVYGISSRQKSEQLPGTSAGNPALAPAQSEGADIAATIPEGLLKQEPEPEPPPIIPAPEPVEMEPVATEPSTENQLMKDYLARWQSRQLEAMEADPRVSMSEGGGGGGLGGLGSRLSSAASGLSSRAAGNLPSSVSQIPSAAGGQLSSLQQQLKQAMPGGGGGMGALTGGSAQNSQQEFLDQAKNKDEPDYINDTRRAGLTPYEVKAGWLIPAVMEHGINSQLPGRITGLVSQNVYDSATGRFLLIPQGARLLGTYDSNIIMGQERLLVVWDRLIFPDGTSINLQGMGGAGQGGINGFEAEVDNHYGRIFGFGLLSTLFNVAYEVSQNDSGNGSVFERRSNSDIASEEISRNLHDLGTTFAERNMNIKPTLTVKPGHRFNVRVDRDLVFNKPYQYGNVTRERDAQFDKMRGGWY